MADFNLRFYMFACPGCALMIQQGNDRAPCCLDPQCPEFGNKLLPWHEMVERIEDRKDGEGWKYGGVG